MYLQANNFQCLRGRVAMPLTGAWTADLAIDPGSSGGNLPATGDPLTITIGEGGFTLQGAVRRINNAFETVLARVVAGGGGLWQDTTAQAYQNATFGLIAGNLLSAVGETLSPTTPSSVTNIQLPFWTIPQLPAYVALAELVLEARLTTSTMVNWRVLPDGTIFVGPETWPQSPLTSYDLMSWEPQELKTTIFALNPNIIPGQLWQSGNVANVEHVVEPEKARTSIWFQP